MLPICWNPVGCSTDPADWAISKINEVHENWKKKRIKKAKNLKYNKKYIWKIIYGTIYLETL